MNISTMSNGAVGLAIWQREQQVKQLQAEIAALYQEIELRRLIGSRRSGPVQEDDDGIPLDSSD